MTEQIYSHFEQNPFISTDTRNITPGSIFFALHGASFDGNDFAREALKAGAAVCIVDRADLRGEERMIYVNDTLTALQDLARHHRRVLGIEILAISGSNGKTTTKELVAAALSKKYKLYATRGNLNNHIGVPLTLLSMGRDVEFGVVEMGASSCHEIELLCSIAEPNYGVLTNVGRAHLLGFGGEEGVRRGKGELFDFLAAHSGEAFVACENETIMQMAREREGLKRFEYSYTLAEGVENNLEGEFNRYNIATAMAIAERFEVSQGDIRAAIAEYRPTNNRSQRLMSERNTLIIDCYNANPSSMQASISNFLGEEFSDRDSKVLILGDMFELGEWSAAEHRRIMKLALSGNQARVYFVGKNFAGVYTPNERSHSFATRAELEQHLEREPLEGCAVLIKGSRGVGLEEILRLL